MLDKSSELKLAQVMAATAEMFSSVIRLLEERGLVGQGEFASAFERCADVAEKDVAGSPFPLGFPRYDILMIRQTAKILTRKRKAGGWQPTIIQGGLSEQTPLTTNLIPVNSWRPPRRFLALGQRF